MYNTVAKADWKSKECYLSSPIYAWGKIKENKFLKE
jgi:hypothetical protein